MRRIVTVILVLAVFSARDARASYRPGSRTRW